MMRLTNRPVIFSAVAISWIVVASPASSLRRHAPDMEFTPYVERLGNIFALAPAPAFFLAPLWASYQLEAKLEGFRCVAATLMLAMTLTTAIAERREQPAPTGPRIRGT